MIFLPFYLGLMVNARAGGDHVPLGGDIVLLQGPIVYFGMIVSLGFFYLISRMRGARWSDFGVKRPKSWFRTVLMSLGVALAILGAVVVVINPVIGAIPTLEPRDMSMYGHLTGNLPNLIINLGLMWVTAAFLEELLWRGYLINRLIDLLGKKTSRS